MNKKIEERVQSNYRFGRKIRSLLSRLLSGGCQLLFSYTPLGVDITVLIPVSKDALTGKMTTPTGGGYLHTQEDDINDPIVKKKWMKKAMRKIKGIKDQLKKRDNVSTPDKSSESGATSIGSQSQFFIVVILHIPKPKDWHAGRFIKEQSGIADRMMNIPLTDDMILKTAYPIFTGKQLRALLRESFDRYTESLAEIMSKRGLLTRLTRFVKKIK